MCGRFTTHLSKKKLAEAIALEIPEEYEPDYNIGPGREVLGIRASKANGPATTMLRWGLRTPQNFHINARLETAEAKPRFREAWAENRCLIPANGFYEWLNDGIRKQPYYIYPPSEGLLFFAGLWFPASSVNEPNYCVVLTTEAHKSVKEIHDRMPVCLPKNMHADWLNNTLARRETTTQAAQINFEKHSVTTRVNSVRNNDSRLVLATTPQTDEQMQLF